MSKRCPDFAKGGKVAVTHTVTHTVTYCHPYCHILSPILSPYCHPYCHHKSDRNRAEIAQKPNVLKEILISVFP